MLILKRKKNDSILIGNDIRITVLDCDNGSVSLAINAPKHISILREELTEAERSNWMPYYLIQIHCALLKKD